MAVGLRSAMNLKLFKSVSSCPNFIVLAATSSEQSRLV